jgi:hypothetical protein
VVEEVFAIGGKKADLATFLLQNPECRKSETVDNWTLLDISIFLGGVGRFSKDFSKISKYCFEGRKSTAEIIRFYYDVFKNSKMYTNWKSVIRSIELKKMKEEKSRK